MTLKLTTYREGNRIPELPGTDMFHSTDLFRTYEATPGCQPILVVASIDNRPVGKLLGVIRKGTGNPFAGLVKKCEIYGTGEYFDTPEGAETIFSDLLQRMTDETLRAAPVIEFRNLPNAKFGYRAFRENRYFAVNWLRVRNSLHSVEKVEDSFSASRIRQIKKGLRNGAVAKEAHTESEIKSFARMLRRVYSWKIRKHLPRYEFFQHLEQNAVSKRYSKIFIVVYKGRVIGGSVCTYSGGNAYLWFSGGARKAYALQYPGILAVWKALDDAKRQGCRHLEFMDVGLPFKRHGYRDFVLRFGGRQTSTRRWFRFRWKWLNGLFGWFYG